MYSSPCPSIYHSDIDLHKFERKCKVNENPEACMYMRTYVCMYVRTHVRSVCLSVCMYLRLLSPGASFCSLGRLGIPFPLGVSVLALALSLGCINCENLRNPSCHSRKPLTPLHRGIFNPPKPQDSFRLNFRFVLQGCSGRCCSAGAT